MEEVKAFTEAKIAMGLNPNVLFYSNLLAGLKQVMTEEVKTADVDGVTLRINPTWFTGLTLPQRIGLLAHEVSHVVYEHPTALKMFSNFKRANKAADYYINLELSNAGLQLPPNGHLDSKYQNWGINEIYADLEDEPDDEYEPDVNTFAPEEDPIKQFEMTNLINNAVNITKAQGGVVPEEVTKLLNKAMSPDVHWYDLLMRFADEFVPNDLTWDDPDYTFMPEFIFPDLSGEQLGHIAFALDSSGSVLDHQYAQFLAAIEDCRKKLPSEKTTIVDFTTQVNNVHELKDEETCETLEFRSYGGTYLPPIFEHFAQGKPPAFLVIFSDLECYAMEEEPPYPVFWICVDNPYAEVNFGTLVHFSTTNN